MPMCQSPQIADALLRARRFPANDNYAPVRTGMKEGILRAACRTFRHRVRTRVGQLKSVALPEARATQRKNQQLPGT